jgi:hypothetical protein
VSFYLVVNKRSVSGDLGLQAAPCRQAHVLRSVEGVGAATYAQGIEPSSFPDRGHMSHTPGLAERVTQLHLATTLMLEEPRWATAATS